MEIKDLLKLLKALGEMGWWGGRFKDVGDRLGQWNKTKFVHVQSNIRKAQTRLKNLQESDPQVLNHDQLRKVLGEVQSWLEKRRNNVKIVVQGDVA